MIFPTTTYRDCIKQALSFLSGGPFSLPLLRKMRDQHLWHQYLKKLPINGIIRVVLPGGEEFLYHSTVSDSLGRRLFWECNVSYEAETLTPFYRLAKKASLVLDIGAYTGLFTLFAAAANPKARVIACEPVPHIYKRLAANVRVNGWENRCQTYQKAVSDHAGVASMHVPAGALPVMSSLHNPGSWCRRKGYSLEVSVVTVDDLCPPGQRVDLVKIDVEGFEDKVLTGMHRVLTESAPALFVEVVPEGPYYAVEEILQRYGYRFFHLRPEGPVPVTNLRPDPQRHFLNYLCMVGDVEILGK
jgi:FkbM family methyltransferase